MDKIKMPSGGNLVRNERQYKTTRATRAGHARYYYTRSLVLQLPPKKNKVAPRTRCLSAPKVMDNSTRSPSPPRPRPLHRPPSPPNDKGVENQGYQHDDQDTNHNQSFTSNGHPKESEKSTLEAVNLEMINMSPKNGKTTKKDVEVDLSSTNPYDEYFVPVNEHRKYMRGEKLYVTADKRSDKGSCKRPLCWTILGLIIAAVVVLIVLAATGILFMNIPTTVEEYNSTISSARAFGDFGRHDQSKEIQNDGFDLKSSEEDNESGLYVPHVLEGSLVINNEEFEPGMRDPDSIQFKEFADNFAGGLKTAIFNHENLNKHYDGKVQVLNIKDDGHTVMYRVHWKPKPAIQPQYYKETELTADMLRQNLMDYLSQTNRMINMYHISENDIMTRNVLNLCLVNRNDCQHQCEFNDQTLDFTCTCPKDQILNGKKKCVSVFEDNTEAKILNADIETSSNGMKPNKEQTFKMNSQYDWKIPTESTTKLISDEADTDLNFSHIFDTDIQNYTTPAKTKSESKSYNASVSEPSADPTAELTAVTSPEPTSEPTTHPTTEAAAESSAEPAAEPAAEPSPEPAAEPSLEPAAEPSPEPAAELNPKPYPEQNSKSNSKTMDKANPEPSPEPTPEPSLESNNKPEPETNPDSTEEPELTGLITNSEMLLPSEGSDLASSKENSDLKTTTESEISQTTSVIEDLENETKFQTSVEITSEPQTETISTAGFTTFPSQDPEPEHISTSFMQRPSHRHETEMPDRFMNIPERNIKSNVFQYNLNYPHDTGKETTTTKDEINTSVQEKSNDYETSFPDIWSSIFSNEAEKHQDNHKTITEPIHPVEQTTEYLSDPYFDTNSGILSILEGDNTDAHQSKEETLIPYKKSLTPKEDSTISEDSTPREDFHSQNNTTSDGQPNNHNSNDEFVYTMDPLIISQPNSHQKHTILDKEETKTDSDSDAPVSILKQKYEENTNQNKKSKSSDDIPFDIISEIDKMMGNSNSDTSFHHSHTNMLSQPDKNGMEGFDVPEVIQNPVLHINRNPNEMMENFRNEKDVKVKETKPNITIEVQNTPTLQPSDKITKYSIAQTYSEAAKDEQTQLYDMLDNKKQTKTTNHDQPTTTDSSIDTGDITFDTLNMLYNRSSKAVAENRTETKGISELIHDSISTTTQSEWLVETATEVGFDEKPAVTGTTETSMIKIEDLLRHGMTKDDFEPDYLNNMESNSNKMTEQDEPFYGMVHDYDNDDPRVKRVNKNNNVGSGEAPLTGTAKKETMYEAVASSGETSSENGNIIKTSPSLGRKEVEPTGESDHSKSKTLSSDDTDLKNINNLNVSIYEVPSQHAEDSDSKENITSQAEHDFNHESDMNPFLPETENNVNLVQKLQQGHDLESVTHESDDVSVLPSTRSQGNKDTPTSSSKTTETEISSNLEDINNSDTKSESFSYNAQTNYTAEKTIAKLEDTDQGDMLTVIPTQFGLKEDIATKQSLDGTTNEINNPSVIGLVSDRSSVFQEITGRHNNVIPLHKLSQDSDTSNTKSEETNATTEFYSANDPGNQEPAFQYPGLVSGNSKIASDNVQATNQESLSGPIKLTTPKLSSENPEITLNNLDSLIENTVLSLNKSESETTSNENTTPSFTSSKSKLSPENPKIALDNSDYFKENSVLSLNKSESETNSSLTFSKPKLSTVNPDITLDNFDPLKDNSVLSFSNNESEIASNENTEPSLNNTESETNTQEKTRSLISKIESQEGSKEDTDRSLNTTESEPTTEEYTTSEAVSKENTEHSSNKSETEADSKENTEAPLSDDKSDITTPASNNLTMSIDQSNESDHEPQINHTLKVRHDHSGENSAKIEHVVFLGSSAERISNPTLNTSESISYSSESSTYTSISSTTETPDTSTMTQESNFNNLMDFSLSSTDMPDDEDEESTSQTAKPDGTTEDPDEDDEESKVVMTTESPDEVLKSNDLDFQEEEQDKDYLSVVPIETKAQVKKYLDGDVLLLNDISDESKKSERVLKTESGSVEA